MRDCGQKLCQHDKGTSVANVAHTFIPDSLKFALKNVKDGENFLLGRYLLTNWLRRTLEKMDDVANLTKAKNTIAVIALLQEFDLPMYIDLRHRNL